MIIIDDPQGTTEWIVNRLWRLTASDMKANITSTGKLSESKAAIKHIDKLIAGIELANEINRSRHIIDEMDDWQLKKFMAHYTGDTFAGSIHTERGNTYEPDAIAAVSERIGSQIQDVGMCVMGDSVKGVVSCSPDGHEYAGGKLVAGCEVKSPCLCHWFGQMTEGILPDDYKLQVHASMAICDLDRWHFGSYFKSKPIFYVEVKREAFTDTIQRSLIEFQDQYRARYAEVMANLQGKEAA